MHNQFNCQSSLGAHMEGMGFMHLRHYTAHVDSIESRSRPRPRENAILSLPWNQLAHEQRACSSRFLEPLVKCEFIWNPLRMQQRETRIRML